VGAHKKKTQRLLRKKRKRKLAEAIDAHGHHKREKHKAKA
jgi:hypothetical protein